RIKGEASSKSAPHSLQIQLIRAQITLARCQLCLSRLLPPGRERVSLLADVGQLLDSISSGSGSRESTVTVPILKARQARMLGEDRLAEKILTTAIEK